MPDLITQVDQIATNPCLKTHDLFKWHNQIISITNTVDSHAIITTIAAFPFDNFKTHNHSNY
jgi:hypothetical protein